MIVVQYRAEVRVHDGQGGWMSEDSAQGYVRHTRWVELNEIRHHPDRLGVTVPLDTPEQIAAAIRLHDRGLRRSVENWEGIYALERRDMDVILTERTPL